MNPTLPYPVAVQGTVRCTLAFEGERIPARVTRASATELTVEVEAEHTLIRANTHVTVDLRTQPAVTLGATVTQRTWSRNQRRYALDLHEVEGTVGTELHALLNRRESVRIAPRTGEFTDVLLQGTDGPSSPVFVGELVDLSETGMQVRLEAGEPAPDGTLEVVMARFRLPRSPRPVGMTCTVQWVRRDVAGHRLGLAFEGARTPHFWRQQEVILDYVQQRQQQSRRRPAAPHAARAIGLHDDALRPVAQTVQFNRANHED